MNQRTHLEERHLYLHLTYIIVFSLLAIALLLPFVLQVSLITTPNYNEGWNAFFALKAMRMENLYSSPGTLVQNNYPPLSFYIVGLIGTLIGDQVIAGRLVSLASMLIVSFNIFLSVFLMTRDRFASVLSGLLYLAIMGAFFNEYIAMDDPQMLAHAFMTSALVVFLRGWDRRMGLPLVAALALAAGLTKHSILAFPMAATLFILYRDRKAFLRWIAWSVLLFACVMAALLALYGWSMVESIVSARVYSIDKVRSGAFDLLAGLQIPLAFWVIVASMREGGRYALLISLYAFFAAAIGLFFYGGEGAGYNQLFDLVIALVIGCGVGLSNLNRLLSTREFPDRILFRRTLPLLLFLGVILATPGNLKDPFRVWHTLKDLEKQNISDIQYLASHEGPALCSSIVLCYWAGKEFEFDPFNIKQAVAMGKMDREQVYERLREQYFRVIQLESGRNRGSGDFMDVFLELIETGYRVERVSANGFFFVPKQ